MHGRALCGILPPVQALDPPRPSPLLFWSVVGTCVGLFALSALSSLILRLPTETMMVDSHLARTVVIEGLLAAAWIPILRRRGWSLECLTRRVEVLDLARGVALFATSYVAYWFAFTFAALAVPPFQEVARSIQIGGTPSWWVVALVSTVNPVAEEFLYLGFITNVVKSGGFQAALIAGILARASIHVYQGPVGIVSSIAVGLVFGMYYLRSGRIWPVVLAHGLADLLALGRLAGTA